MRVFFPLLLFTFPLFLHIGIAAGRLNWALIYLVVLLAMPVLAAWKNRMMARPWQWLALLLVTWVLVFAPQYEAVIVKMLPFALNLALCGLFAVSLGRGRVPLITRFASLMRKSMPPPVQAYTRMATMAWMVYFFCMSLLSLLLALHAPLRVWSLFSNVISYLLLGAMFTAEFLVRRRILRAYMDYGFREFLRRLSRVNFREVVLPSGSGS